MGKSLKLGVLLLAAALIFGCASQKNGFVANSDSHFDTLATTSAPKSLAENDPASGKMIVKKAKSAIGTPYVLGGSDPAGFDCSGLVQWTYNSLGVTLPRTAREQASVGRKVRDLKDMREGDIVAFRHPKRGYHTGIYVGDGKFVHSPRKRSKVRINSLSDPYFKSTLLGARRVDLSGSENLLASASNQLEEFVAEKSRLSLSARNLEKIKSVSKKAPGKKTHITRKNTQNHKTMANNKGTKKSTIAHNARKIQSIKAVTGKTRHNDKNSGAHAKLASASKNATAKAATNKKAVHKSVSMLHKKTTSHSGRASRS